MALKKFCRCGKVIDYTNKYCAECKVIVEQQQKERYKDYSKRRTDKKEQSFYHCKEWMFKRGYILSLYNYIDVYAYYKEGVVMPANLVHHIIPIKISWDKRMEDSNLFICGEVSHSQIHRRIDTEGLDVVAKELIEFNKRFINEFNIKVDC